MVYTLLINKVPKGTFYTLAYTYVYVYEKVRRVPFGTVFVYIMYVPFILFYTPMIKYERYILVLYLTVTYM